MNSRSLHFALRLMSQSRCFGRDDRFFGEVGRAGGLPRFTSFVKVRTARSDVTVFSLSAPLSWLVSNHP